MGAAPAAGDECRQPLFVYECQYTTQIRGVRVLVRRRRDDHVHVQAAAAGQDELGVLRHRRSASAAAVVAAVARASPPPPPLPSVPAVDGAVRLVDGTSPGGGRLDVKYGSWGTVSYNSFSASPDGDVVCKQLGLGTAKWAGAASTKYGVGADMPIWIQSVGCSGGEARLIDCYAAEAVSYSHAYDVAVECSDHTPSPPPPYHRGRRRRRQCRARHSLSRLPCCPPRSATLAAPSRQRLLHDARPVVAQHQ